MRVDHKTDRLAALYSRFGPIIFARCRRLLGDNAGAEDATQETFMRVQRHLERTPQEALAWIYRIATNYCLNELRNRGRRAEPCAELPELVDTSLEAALADRDLAARIIGHIDPRIAIIAWMHYVDGMEQQEVADVMGVSRRTVVNRLTDFNRKALKFVGRTTG